MLNCGLSADRLSRLVLSLAMAGVLSACGGGGGDSSSNGEASAVDEAGLETFTVHGSIGDGPVINADVFIFDAKGGLITSHKGDAFANYSLTFKSKGNQYPVTLEAIRGTDLVTGMRPDFTLKAVSLSPGQKRVNLNPFSTLIVEMVRTMPGGFTPANVDVATGIVIREMNFGLDTSSVAHPMFTAIDESNIANIVRSSEALGELIRRTRTGLALAGYIYTHNDVVNAISKDLADGRLDGRGADGTSRRISAVAGVAASQIVIEQFQNRLYVNGTLAVSAMDSAITQTLPATPANALTGSVRIPQAMIDQALHLMTALAAVDSRPEIAALRDAISTIPAGSTTNATRIVLNDDHSRLLDATVTNVAQTDEESLAAFMSALAGETPAPVEPAPETNNSPVIGGVPPTNVVEASSYAFTPSAADSDGDTLTFSIQNRPRWATFNATTGRLTGTPASTDVGRYSDIVITVSDGKTTASLPAFTVEVIAQVVPNSAPTISGTPATLVNQGTAYSFAPLAGDADGNALTFSIANKPGWLSFNSSTGRLFGTPTNSHVGSYSNILISVSDGTASASLPAFSITVVNVNDPPVIGGVPASSVYQGSPYTFTPTAGDVDGDSLTFAVANKPGWMNFNTSTGRLSGTPTNSHVGAYGNIVISVSDGRASAALPAFTVTVVNVNDAPTISGVPSTSVGAGSFYSFTPSAMDIDGDSLTFSISNRPAWASFNTSTGRLSGTPTESHVGSYGNIVISVTDGQATARLSAFSINVASTAPATRDVTLQWVAPAARADGTALSLSQIAGFRIHYGASAGNYTNSLEVRDPSATSYTIENMEPGTYYFAVTALDTEGLESEYSTTVTTTLQ